MSQMQLPKTRAASSQNSFPAAQNNRISSGLVPAPTIMSQLHGGGSVSAGAATNAYAALSGNHPASSQQHRHAEAERFDNALEIDTPAGHAQAAHSQASPITTMIHGTAYTSDQIRYMGEVIAEARRAGQLPATTSPSFITENTVEDYETLMRLREAMGDPNIYPRSPEYNVMFVDAAHHIQQRDAQYREEVRDNNVHNLVQNLVHNQNVGADMHQIIHNAAAGAVQQVLANNRAQSVDGNMVREISQAAIQNLMAQGVIGAQSLNMEAVLEDVIGVVEAAALDATGPLRLNVNRMGEVLSGHSDTISGQLNNMTTQVGAMNNHVSAVGNHVSALGALMQVANNTITATNTQMGQVSQQVSNQVNGLQQLVTIIPALIQQSIQQNLPGVIQSVLVPMLAASLQGAAGNGKGFSGDFTTAFGNAGKTENRDFDHSVKKVKKGGFLRRFCRGLFKKGNTKDSRHGGFRGDIAC
ncbi:hypothetical protein BJ170DRAFT_484442 [Xylariales sp. AK1849]|nr:hypothetical protein BJ170DRAFT_484442 [Xylariales sp. AK1849]